MIVLQEEMNGKKGRKCERKANSTIAMESKSNAQIGTKYVLVRANSRPHHERC